MHSPETLAHEINIPWFKGKKLRIASIWHVDPEKDGTDDSCGWFMRARHGNPEMREKIKKAIDFSFDRTFESDTRKHTYFTGYFDNVGSPQMSVHAIVLGMFYSAAWEFFRHNRKKTKRWMNDNLFDILQFAENPVDSLRDSVTGFFRIPCEEKWNREHELDNYVSTIYGWLLRETRPWYKHPRWHIHHWSIQIHPLQNLKRRFWDKCSVCGKRGAKTYFMSDWNGTKRWHQECDTTIKNNPTEQ